MERGREQSSFPQEHLIDTSKFVSGKICGIYAFGEGVLLCVYVSICVVGEGEIRCLTSLGSYIIPLSKSLRSAMSSRVSIVFSHVASLLPKSIVPVVTNLTKPFLRQYTSILSYNIPQFIGLNGTKETPWKNNV